jgi:tryptophan synthase alpha chain
LTAVGKLEECLRFRRDAGRKLLVPYVTGGLGSGWLDVVRAIADAGADAIEVGIPFSDPVMDGGVIQEASRLALEAGATPGGVLGTIKEAGLGVPVAVMTYVNPVYRRGLDAFLEDAVAAGVSGAIVPDLPVDEAAEWLAAAERAGVDAVMLAAPGSSAARLRSIASASHGFVYCVAAYGVTGVRDELASTARDLVAGVRPLTDVPLLVGVGIGTPEQAEAACAFADGVIVGSALVRHLVEGDRESAVSAAKAFRAAIAR